MPETLLDIGGVCRQTSLSRSYLYRLMERGQFPTPVYPGAKPGKRSKAPRWIMSEIESWIDERAKERDAGLGNKAA